VTRGQARVLRQHLQEQRRAAVQFTGEISALTTRFADDDYAVRVKMDEVRTESSQLLNRLDELKAIIDFVAST
jgi:hypothetical protein